MNRKSSHRKSILYRFQYSLLITVLAVFAASFILFFSYAASLSNKRLKENVNLTLENTKERILKTLENIEATPDNLKETIFLSHLMPSEIAELSRHAVNVNPNIYGSAIAFEPDMFPAVGRYCEFYSWQERDTIHTEQIGNENHDYFLREWYTKTKETNADYWSNPYYDGVMMVTYSAPIHKDGKFVGVFSADISLEWINKLANSVKPYAKSTMLIVGRDGTFLANPEERLVIDATVFSYADSLHNGELRNIGQAMVDGLTGSAVATYKGEKSYIFYTPVPRLDWSIALIIPQKYVLAEFRTQRILLIIIAVFGLALVFLLTWRLIRKLRNPLKTFARLAKQISHGDFTVAIPEMVKGDEISELRDAFVNMESELLKYIDELKFTISEKEKTDSELRVAQGIQMTMVPTNFAAVGQLAPINLHAALKPAKMVGGDLYDFIVLNNKLYLIVGDVAGKGVPASLFMAITCGIFRAVVAHAHSAQQIVSIINKTLAYDNVSSMFVTLLVAVVDLESGHMQLCNAGHLPPIVSGNTAVFADVATNLPAGVFDDTVFVQNEVTLQPGTTVILYSDGITEATNLQDELFGATRLLALAGELKDEPVEKIVKTIVQQAGEFEQGREQSDDMTVLIFKWKPVR